MKNKSERIKPVSVDSPPELHLDPFESIVEDLRLGKPILLVDDSDRENEADLVVAAELVTPEQINFMLQHGKGLICLSLAEERLKELEIPFQAVENTSVLGTNFAVSIDHVEAKDSGVTASGRALTIRRAADPQAKPQDFIRPGHVFPLGAVRGGVLKRRGQTEGSVELARLAGLLPAAVICEVMAEDGSMVRGEALEKYREQFGLKLGSIEQIVQHRLRHEVCIRQVSEGVISNVSQSDLLKGAKALELPVRNAAAGDSIRVIAYCDDVDGKEHLVFVKGTPHDGCLVRIHSECLTGDVFESKRCDCGYQLKTALATIDRVGEGVLVYLYQEGRGIGLGNKMRAYELQEQGFDTVDANVKLGFAPDQRDYRVAAKILSDLKLRSIRLMTNNPGKVDALREFGIKVEERISLSAEIDDFNREYLKTKRERFGHLFGGISTSEIEQ